MTVGSKITYRVITSVSLMGLVGAPLAAASPVLPVLVQATTPAATTIPTTARFFKTGTTTASDASHFFSDQASLKTANGQLQLVMTMPTGANYVQKLQIQGSNQAATIQKNGEQATVTSNLPNQSGKYVVEMDLQLAPGMTMHEAADLQVDLSQVKTASAEADSSQATSSSQTTTSTATTKSDHQQAQPTTQVSQAGSTAKPTAADQLQLPLAITKENAYTTPSEAASFFTKQVNVKPVGDGYDLTFQLASGGQFIQKIAFNGQAPTNEQHHGSQATYTFHLGKAAYELGGGKFTFNLTIPGGTQMTEQAYAIWQKQTFTPAKYNHWVQAGNQTAPTTTVTTANQSATTTDSGIAGIDPNKAVQDIGYAVYKEDQSGLSDANTYYTHSAHVVKTGSTGYDVTLTVKAPTGLVSFAPLSMAAGPIVGHSKTTQGGNDLWTYTFHIANAAALNQPVAGQIRVGVPMMNMPNTNYRVWFKFGKAVLGGGPGATGYGTSNAAAALSASAPAGGDITSQPGAANAAAITPFDLKAAQKRLAHYRVPNGIKHRIQAALIDYPIVQALTAFLVTGFAIIGGTMLWYTRATRKLKGLNHEAD